MFNDKERMARTIRYINKIIDNYRLPIQRFYEWPSEIKELVNLDQYVFTKYGNSKSLETILKFLFNNYINIKNAKQISNALKTKGHQLINSQVEKYYSFAKKGTGSWYDMTTKQQMHVPLKRKQKKKQSYEDLHPWEFKDAPFHVTSLGPRTRQPRLNFKRKLEEPDPIDDCAQFNDDGDAEDADHDNCYSTFEDEPLLKLSKYK